MTMRTAGELTSFDQAYEKYRKTLAEFDALEDIEQKALLFRRLTQLLIVMELFIKLQ